MADNGDSVDHYDHNADIYDATALSFWPPLKEGLRRLLATPPPNGTTVVDVGAGTGLATVVLAKSCPDSEVIAVEPAAGLRAGLLARVVDDPDLTRRVTVLPSDWAGAADSLNTDVARLTAINMIGHLPPDDRRKLWDFLAERLLPQGIAVIGLHPLTEAQAVPEQDFGGVQVGRLRYTGNGSAVPSGPGQVTWDLRWQVLDGAKVITEYRTVARWWPVSPDMLEREAVAAGLRMGDNQEPELGLYTLTR
jgi:cyclopropane fatty-acyl-phospholipid synthase-like methyltransferase